MIFHPHGYQKRAMSRIVNCPACGLFLDMGLGKTVITLTALRKLIGEGKVKKALIIAPKSVAENTWQQEALKWDHLGDLRFSKVLGDKDRRLKALNTPAHIYIINRENVPWLVKTMGSRWDFDTVVIDELSSFKNPRAERFLALKSARKKIRRVIGLTGTPAGSGYMDLWAQLFLLDGGKRLGTGITKYRQRYFKPNKYIRHQVVSWKLLPGAKEQINRRISDICVSMSAADYLELPELSEIEVPVKVPDSAMSHYRNLVSEFVTDTGGGEITAQSAASLSGKLLQVASGAAYKSEGDGEAVDLHSAKLDALKDIVAAARAQGESVLVFYWFKFEPQRIRKALKGYNVRELGKDCTPEEWNAGGADVLLCQPQSAGYGLNLQQGGRIIVWTVPTWSLELWQQANARLYRQGQEKPVIIYKLIAEGTIDRKVYQALGSKDDLQSAMLAAIKEEIR